MNGLVFLLRKAVAILFIPMMSVTTTACFQQSTDVRYSNELSSEETLTPEYAMVAPQVVMNNMTSSTGLGLPQNDQSVSDIRNKRVQLGDADPFNRITRNPKATAGKFKLVFENYMNACSDSLGISANPSTAQQNARARLFPNGTSSWNGDSFNTLFLTFLGRAPSGAEAAALLGVVNEVAPQVGPAAACAAALSSLEALNGT